MLLFPQPMHPFEVHSPAGAQQQLMHAFAAETWIPLAPATQLLDQPSLIIRPATAVALGRARLTQHATESAFRYVIRPQTTTNRLDGPTPSLRAHQFGRAASRRI